MSLAETTGSRGNDANREAARLQACPRCDYALSDREDETICPECGLAIDRRWEIFRPRRAIHPRFWPFLAAIFSALQLGLAVAAAFSIVSKKGWQMTPFEGFQLGVLPCGAVVFAVVLQYFARRGQTFLAVGPRGLALAYSDGAVQAWDWDAMSELRVAVKLGRLMFNVRGDVVQLHLALAGHRMSPIALAIERHLPGSNAAGPFPGKT